MELNEETGGSIHGSTRSISRRSSERKTQPTAEESANWVSMLLFAWVGKVMQVSQIFSSGGWLAFAQRE